ncbi:MAG TPA: tRNA (cytidine(56)-2'-O)-methyltransferase [Nitrososphaeraceae archaeon]|nr:tRNA (cytidine(56)-2'-O)-methyltransferase [Nitrososphaeraceae archaeon]
MNIAVLRIGHRLVRDDRTTTHVALVSRSFGCNILYMTDVNDDIKSTIDDVNNRWGYASNFKIEIVKNWRNTILNWKKNGGIVIHLTMYGLNVDDIISKIKNSSSDILIIVGAEKVPSEVYKLSDYNIAVGNQPHSEISALAIVLDRIYDGKQLKLNFKSAKMKIIPSIKEKIIEKNNYLRNTEL